MRSIQRLTRGRTISNQRMEIIGKRESPIRRAETLSTTDWRIQRRRKSDKAIRNGRWTMDNGQWTIDHRPLNGQYTHMANSHVM